MSDAVQAPSKVLIYRLGSLGDTVVALPCFRRIAEVFPNAERIVLTNRPVSSKAAPLEIILRAGGFIHRAIDYPVGLRDPRALIDLARRIRSERIDTLVYVGGGRGSLAVWRDLVFFRACGIRTVIGAPTTPDLATNRVDEAGVVEPEASRLARCLASLGTIDLSADNAFDLNLTPEEHAKARTLLTSPFDQPFMAVNTGGKVVEKDWGEANWIALLTALAPHLALPVVFVGGAEDSERAQTLGKLWSGPWLDACGKLAPRETAALLTHAAFFVGHDSGPMHLAAAAGAPCIGLFGVINRPRKWHPFGAQHHILHDTAGVERIAVAQVSEAIGAMASRYAPIPSTNGASLS
jgi:heptosyltransferase-3